MAFVRTLVLVAGFFLFITATAGCNDDAEKARALDSIRKADSIAAVMASCKCEPDTMRYWDSLAQAQESRIMDSTKKADSITVLGTKK